MFAWCFYLTLQNNKLIKRQRLIVYYQHDVVHKLHLDYKTYNPNYLLSELNSLTNLRDEVAK